MGETSTRHAATIVIPLKSQRDDWLRQCLSSAVLQTAACEVVVVTHPDTPASNQWIIEEFREHHPNLLVSQRERPGFAAAINHGFETATTGRIGLLHSDDWLESDTVARCLEHTSDIVCTGMTYHDDAGSVFLTRSPNRCVFDGMQAMSSRVSYLKHFLLFDRHKLEQIGGVDETVGDTGPDDYDMIWTLLEHGATVDILGAPLYHYRDHSEERLTLRNRQAQTKDLCKILDKHDVTGPERDCLLAINTRWYGQSIQSVLKAGRNRAATG